MSRVKLKLVNDRIVPSLEKIAPAIEPIIKDAANFYRSHTPIKSGNARRNTRYRPGQILADYDYATKLDSGASRQAPDGMTKPTLTYLNKRLDRLFKGK